MPKENEKSTPVETPKDDVKNHVNQSTEENQKSNNGMIAIIAIILLIILGILFFSGWWVF